MKIYKFIVAIFFIFINLFAETNVTQSDLNLQISNIKSQISNIDESLKDEVLITRFSNFLSYKELEKTLNEYQKKLEKTKNSDESSRLRHDIETIKEQMTLFSEFKNTPFANIFQTPDLGENMRVKNPFAIISGYSNIRNLQDLKIEQQNKFEKLQFLTQKLKEKEILYDKLAFLDDKFTNSSEFINLKYEVSEFNSALVVATTTQSVFEKKIDEQIATLTNDIKIQIKRALNIGIIIVVVIFLSFLFKFIAKKYIKDNENFYLANKIINVLNFSVIALILLLSYIENMSYFITVLGFASAGLAIAMKDMFMSSLGWIIIVFGGEFRVGDRIKVKKDGVVYVGDIIDISVLRITIYEDITYTTWKENKRAGRIIFIPNNYIFTELISNYTHSGMKTVWDGIDIMLTFDSNHKKAMYIIKNIARKYSKGYTDIAKKQMSKLRSQYSIKNPNVEPRIFSFFEPYGIQISVWYMTNSYATLGLRSNISSEILDALQKEDDITIAYPSYTLWRGKKSIPPEIEQENNENMGSLF